MELEGEVDSVVHWIWAMGPRDPKGPSGRSFLLIRVGRLFASSSNNSQMETPILHSLFGMCCADNSIVMDIQVSIIQSASIVYQLQVNITQHNTRQVSISVGHSVAQRQVCVQVPLHPAAPAYHMSSIASVACASLKPVCKDKVCFEPHPDSLPIPDAQVICFWCFEPDAKWWWCPEVTPIVSEVAPSTQDFCDFETLTPHQNGGFPWMGVSKIVALHYRKIPLKWMIWVYPCFRKPPFFPYHKFPL